MSGRATITEALLTQLESIDGTGGYSTIVELVERNVPHPETRTIPPGRALVSLSDSGDLAAVLYGASNKALYEMTLDIHCAIQAARFGLVPQVTMDNWISDLRKLVLAINTTPAVMGANFVFIEALQHGGRQLTDDGGQVTVQVRIVYWVDQAAP